MDRSFWDRFGASIVLGDIFVPLAGLLIYGNATRGIEQGYDKPMQRSSAR